MEIGWRVVLKRRVDLRAVRITDEKLHRPLICNGFKRIRRKNRFTRISPASMPFGTKDKDGL
jgi:hypothetical protein